MCRDTEAAERLAYISPDEAKLLKSQARPIVLLKKREGTVPGAVSSNAYVGIMLPYTPLHYLIFEKGPEALADAPLGSLRPALKIFLDFLDV